MMYVLMILVAVLAFEYGRVLNATRGLSELPDRLLVGRLLILGNPNKRSRRQTERILRHRERIRQQFSQ